MIKKIVFLDLDGTILTGINSEVELIKLLLKSKIIGYKQIINYIKIFFNNLLSIKNKIIISNKGYLDGLIVDDVLDIVNESLIDLLFLRINRDMQNIISEFNSNKIYQLILLTGCPDFIAFNIAKKLNISEVHSTNIMQVNSKFYVKKPCYVPYDINKFFIAEKICMKYSIKPQHCFSYANSIHDIYLMRYVGRPIAVTPDKKLLKIAIKNNWEIIY